MERKTAILTGVGAACAAAIGFALGRRKLIGSTDKRRAPALTSRRPLGPVGHSGNARPAGPDSMRDPPAQWGKVDEASDQSFPASDPPSLSPHID